MPTGYHGYYDRIRATVQEQHEGINGRLKMFKCLRDMYRHKRSEHYLFFSTCLLMVQLQIEEDGGTFQVEEYKEPVYMI